MIPRSAQPSTVLALSNLPPLQLDLRLPRRNHEKLMQVTHRPRICLRCIGYPKVPFPDELNQDYLQLVGREETTGTCMISVAESQRFGRGGDEEMFILLPRHLAEVVEAKAVELAGRLVLRWIVFR